MCVVIVQRIFHMNFGTMTAKEIFQANDNILQAYENKLAGGNQLVTFKQGWS